MDIISVLGLSRLCYRSEWGLPGRVSGVRGQKPCQGLRDKVGNEKREVVAQIHRQGRDPEM